MDGDELPDHIIATAATDFAKAVAPSRSKKVAGIVGDMVRATSLLRERGTSRNEFVRIYGAIIAPAIMPTPAEGSVANELVKEANDRMGAPTGTTRGTLSALSSTPGNTIGVPLAAGELNFAKNVSSVERLRRFVQLLHAQQLVEVRGS